MRLKEPVASQEKNKVIEGLQACSLMKSQEYVSKI